MKRSAGITASAVVCFAGSALSILLGIVMILPVLMPNPVPDRPRLPAGTTAALIVMQAVYVGFGIWGIISGIGLLRLRNWARICFAIFGGILCFFSLSGALGALAGIYAIPKIAQTQNVPQGLMTAVFAAVIMVALLCAALGVFWVIYFNRLGIKSQFQSEVVADTRGVPLSMTVIAWVLILGGVSTPIFLLTRFPVALFSFVVRGPAGRAVYVLIAIVSLVSGIGILKKRVKAHSLAMGYIVFALLNTLSFLVIPGSTERMESMMQEVGASQPMPVSSGILMVPSVLLIIVALWFLITRRRAFIERCGEV